MTSTSDRAELRALCERSVAIIRRGQDPGGAYIASPAFPVYRYSWLRDGAFIADAMSRVGQVDSAEAFLDWCALQLTRRVDQVASLIRRGRQGAPIADDEFLPTRYTLSGGISVESWPDFQLDGYGAWLWAADRHGKRWSRSTARWRDGAVLSARYIAAFWSRPSYDWWEEHPDARHGSTLAAVAAGLAAVAGWESVEPDDRAAFSSVARAIRDAVLDDARRIGRLAKWLGGDGIDASLLASGVAFGLLHTADPLMVATASAVENILTFDHGVHRYPDDTYYGGGQWLLLSAFLGWHHAAVGREADAHAQLEWVAAHATSAGELPEQVGDHLLAPTMRDHWLSVWGPVATPLLWSHAMYLTVAAELGIVRPVGARVR